MLYSGQVYWGIPPWSSNIPSGALRGAASYRANQGMDHSHSSEIYEGQPHPDQVMVQLDE